METVQGKQIGWRSRSQVKILGSVHHGLDATYFKEPSSFSFQHPSQGLSNLILCTVTRGEMSSRPHYRGGNWNLKQVSNHRLTIWPSDSTSTYLPPPKLKTGTQIDTMYMLWTCTPLSIAALFTVAESGNNLSVHQLRMNKRKVAYPLTRRLFSHKKEWRGLPLWSGG